MFRESRPSQTPRSTRRTESRFERTPEWASMKARLEEPLLPWPDGEARQLEVLFADSEKEKFGIRGRRTIPRFVAQYLKEKGLKYKVKSIRRHDVEHVIVIGPAAKKPRKAKA